MLADKVRAPWRLAVAAIGMTAIAWSVGQLVIGRAEQAVDAAQGTAGGAGARPVYVHVKLAHARAWSATIASAHVPHEMLFTSYAASAEIDESDPRTQWMRVAARSIAEADELVRRLAVDPAVEQAFVAPDITLATTEWAHEGAGEDVGIDGRDAARQALIREDVWTSVDDGPSCPLTTPSYESYQGYLGPAPHGIDAPSAWMRGFRGRGVWFADIEGGWNAQHEDLPGDRIANVIGEPVRDPMWRAHGTAVLGEVAGRDNGKGVVGIAPDVERVFTGSIFGTSVANAIDATARQLRPGDVLLIELQGGGPRGRYIPVEYWDDVYAAIAAATKRGVIVVEAAGNGGENLDHVTYDRKFDPKKRDSGAIMVGAGGPPRTGFKDRERLDFSNYGARVNVQGWGRKVATLDYGDLQACDDDEGVDAGAYTDRHYTNEFSGTSSASPIVAGAAVILEGIARERKGRALSPAELRALLESTGTPQLGNTKERIGPRPDLARAIERVVR
ncbi:MAG TPA: S8 family serine peptidase [Kofleriaceae bacterium]|nr:S8 family serine peptidase [Kofleriaceae bacterium]